MSRGFYQSSMISVLGGLSRLMDNAMLDLARLCVQKCHVFGFCLLNLWP